MNAFERRREEADLARLARIKQRTPPSASALGPELLQFFKTSVEKRNAKFCRIADVWIRLIPVTLAEHAALESFSRGTLSVIVDSSSHLYELKQLLLAGLEQQMKLACGSAGLKKISLRRGSWYEETSDPDARKIKF